MRAARALLFVLCVTACGLERVELAPQPSDVVVLDDVPRDAFDRLLGSNDTKPEPRLRIVYPSNKHAFPKTWRRCASCSEATKSRWT